MAGTLPHILLMGARGSGKSTVGRLLAARLGRTFIDLDEAALARLGATSVAAVWQERGEEAWRQAEVAALDEVIPAPAAVAALGGGTPMIGAARQRLEQARGDGRAWLVYLRCRTDVLQARLAGGCDDRPSLTGEDPVAEVAAVLAAREETYVALADLVYDVTDVSPGRAADELFRSVPG